MSTEADSVQHRTQCEQALVAIAFRDPAEAIDRVLSIVGPSDFADSDLGTVYEVLHDMHRAGLRIELEACAVQMKKRGIVDRIGKHELKKILDRQYSVSNAEFYAREVARLADVRRLVRAAERIIDQQHDIQAQPQDMLDRFISGSRLERCSDDAATLAACVREMLSQHEAIQTEEGKLGMRTGFPSLDKATSGMHRQQLWLLAARSTTGKTALALALANNLASGWSDDAKRGVVMFSMEMSRTELAERICSDELGINYSRFNHSSLEQKHFEQIRNNLNDFEQWPFMFLDKPSQSVEEIEAKAKLYAPAAGLDLIVVDTLQRVRPRNPKQDRRLQLQQIANDLKDIAKRLNCCLLVCSQLNADAENREPDLTHLSEGKQIIEPVDTCLLLHRADPKTPQMLVKIAKNRRGNRLNFKMTFDGKFQRFTDADSQHSRATLKNGEWVA